MTQQLQSVIIMFLVLYPLFLILLNLSSSFLKKQKEETVTNNDLIFSSDTKSRKNLGDFPSLVTFRPS